MKTTLKSIIRALFILLFCLAACAPQPATLSKEDVAAIREASSRYVETIKAGNYNAWSTLLTEDAVFMSPNRLPIEGREANRALLEGRPGRDLKLTIIEIEGSGDLAFVRGQYAAEVDSTKQEGKYIEIWKKQADGSWQIYRDIWNSDLPLPESQTEATSN